jgi:mannitol-specific phosphotransferase system IIBC component
MKKIAAMMVAAMMALSFATVVLAEEKMEEKPAAVKAEKKAVKVKKEKKASKKSEAKPAKKHKKEVAGC